VTSTRAASWSFLRAGSTPASHPLAVERVDRAGRNFVRRSHLGPPWSPAHPRLATAGPAAPVPPDLAGRLAGHVGTSSPAPSNSWPWPSAFLATHPSRSSTAVRRSPPLQTGQFRELAELENEADLGTGSVRCAPRPCMPLTRALGRALVPILVARMPARPGAEGLPNRTVPSRRQTLALLDAQPGAVPVTGRRIPCEHTRPPPSDWFGRAGHWRPSF